MVLEEVKDLEDLEKIADITKLEPGKHVYIVQVQVGDMPKDIVSCHLQGIKYLLDNQGITNAIIIPVDSEGHGALSIKELKNNN